MPVTYRIFADSPDELSEPLRKVAKQVDGKFVVDALPEGFAFEDVRGLKNTVSALKGELSESKQVAKAFVDAGLTPEQAKEAAEAIQKVKAGALKSNTEIEAWKQAAEAKFQADAKALGDKLSKRTEVLRDQLVRGKLAPLVAAKGGARAMNAILTLAERNIRVEEDAQGNLVPVVVGSDGKSAALTKKSGSMDPMGFDELIDLMRESPETRGLFDANATGGTGSASQTAGRGSAGNQGSAQSLTARDLFQEANDRSMASRAQG